MLANLLVIHPLVVSLKKVIAENLKEERTYIIVTRWQDTLSTTLQGRLNSRRKESSLAPPYKLRALLC